MLGLADTMSVACLTKYGLLLLIPYFVFLGIYRVFFHPLSGFRGPRLAALTNGYTGWYAIKGQGYRQVWNDHLKYGSVVRVGPNKLVFNSLTAVRDIYLNENVSKSIFYDYGRVATSPRNIFNTIDKQLHRSKRKRIAPIVNERSMRTFAPTMMEHVDSFVRQILVSSQEEPDRAINMSERCRWLGLEVVAKLAFGFDLDLQTATKFRWLVRTMKYGGYRLNAYMQWPFLRALQFEIPNLIVMLIRGVSFLKLLNMMIKTRLAEDKHARHDLYSFMIDAPNPNGKEGQDDRLALKEIWTEAIFFMPAGGDTVSTAMSSTFFYLAKNPECKKRLAEEIRTTYQSGADIQANSQLTGCQYLRACIDEALRMTPPASAVLWRAQDAEAREPFIVDGHVIPRGTQVGMSAYTIHHDEKYFPEPFAYKPERWLPKADGTGNDEMANKAAFVAFSVGQRGCAGKAMAYQEVSLAIAKAIFYFDFEMAEGFADGSSEFQFEDIFTSAHEGPYLKFRPRGTYWKDLVSNEVR